MVRYGAFAGSIIALIPEPAAAALLGFGLLGIVGYSRRRMRMQRRRR